MANEQEKIVDDPFEILDELSQIGKTFEKVKILDDFELTLVTLEADDEMNIFENASKYEGQEFINNLQRETLAFSISEINGKPLRKYEQIKDEKEREKVKKETIDKIRSIVKTWKEELVAFVHSKYSAMIERNEAYLKSIGIIQESSQLFKIEETTELPITNAE